MRINRKTYDSLVYRRLLRIFERCGEIPTPAHAFGMLGGLSPHRPAASPDARSPSGLRTSTVSRQSLPLVGTA